MSSWLKAEIRTIYANGTLALVIADEDMNSIGKLHLGNCQIVQDGEEEKHE